MAKQQSSNKKGTIIFVVSFLIIVFIISVLVVVKTIETSKENINKTSSKYDTIMNFDFENNYPTSPDKVMESYCYITQYLYSDEIKDSEIPDVLRKSNELLHFVTLSKTTEDQQIAEVLKTREIINGTNSFITNMTCGKVIIDTQFPNYANCTCTQYTKSGENLLGDYTLQMDDYKWKIYSWDLKGTSSSNGK